MRPCPHPVGPPRADRCAVCHLYVERPDYREMCDSSRGPADPPGTPPVPLPCAFWGGRVFVPGSNREWRSCEKGIDHGRGPGVVCPCQGCGPKCPKYTPGNPEDGD